MEENTFSPQLILKLWNSLSSGESQKFRWIQKAIGQNKKSLFLPNNTADRREQGFTSPLYEMEQKASQGGVNITPNHQHSKSQLWAVQQFEETNTQFIQPKCSLLLYICLRFGPWIFHHGEALVQPQKCDSTHRVYSSWWPSLYWWHWVTGLLTLILTDTRKPQQALKQLLGIKKHR